MFTARVRARGLVVKCAVRFTTSRQTEKYRIGREYRYCLFTGTVGTGVRYCTGTGTVPEQYCAGRTGTARAKPSYRYKTPRPQAVHRWAG